MGAAVVTADVTDTCAPSAAFPPARPSPPLWPSHPSSRSSSLNFLLFWLPNLPARLLRVLSPPHRLPLNPPTPAPSCPVLFFSSFFLPTAAMPRYVWPSSPIRQEVRSDEERRRGSGPAKNGVCGGRGGGRTVARPLCRYHPFTARRGSRNRLALLPRG